MPPRLPAQALQQILACAVEDQPPADQQLSRNTFRRVCKHWYRSFTYWEDLSVAVPKALVLLLSQLKVTRSSVATLAEAGTCAQIQRAHFDLVAPAEVGEEVARTLGSLAMSTAGSLVELMPSLRRLSSRRDRYCAGPLLDDNTDYLEHAALLRRDKLEHFTYQGVHEPDTFHCPGCSVASLREMLASWPRIKTLELLDTYIPTEQDDTVVSIYPPNCALTTVRLRMAVEAKALLYCLTHLPATVTALELDDFNLLADATDRSTLTAQLKALAPQLRAFALLDSPVASLAPQHVPAAARGGFNRVVGRLAKVERLAITPYAVGNLARALVPLARLAELTLQQGCSFLTDRVGAGEVAEYVARQAGLRRLTVNRLLWGEWAEEDRQALADVAREKGVALVYAA